MVLKGPLLSCVIARGQTGPGGGGWFYLSQWLVVGHIFLVDT